MRKHLGNHYKLVSIFIILIVFSFLISCSKEQNNGKIKLTFGHFVGVVDKPYMQECLDTFQKLNPDIEIVPEPTPWEQYFNKLNIRFAAENPPDIIMMSTEFIDPCVDAGNLLNLNQFIDKDTTFSLKDYYPELLERLSRDGKLYVLPRDIDVMACVYYNKNLFKRFHLKQPTDDWTWQEFFTDCTTFARDTDNDGKQDLWGISIYGFFHALVYSNGGRLVDDWRKPTRCTLDDPHTIEAFKLWQDLTVKYKAMPSGVALSSLGLSEPDMFTQQRMAMFLAGIWMTPQFSKITSFDWDCVAIPKGPSGPRKFMVEGSGYAITKYCKHPDAAWRFVKFFGGQQGQRILSKPGLTEPSLMTLARSSVFLNGQPPANRKVVTWSALEGMYNPTFSDWREIQTSFIFPVVEQMMNPDPSKYIPADKALKDLNKKINREYFDVKE